MREWTGAMRAPTPDRRIVGKDIIHDDRRHIFNQPCAGNADHTAGDNDDRHWHNHDRAQR